MQRVEDSIYLEHHDRTIAWLLSVTAWLSITEPDFRAIMLGLCALVGYTTENVVESAIARGTVTGYESAMSTSNDHK